MNSSNSEEKIAFVNIDYVIQNSNIGKKMLANINNLDKKYSNCFNRLFWLRRLEQHNLTKKLSGKNNFVDRFITNFFLKFFI